jgi:hypothetical protein
MYKPTTRIHRRSTNGRGRHAVETLERRVFLSGQIFAMTHPNPFFGYIAEYDQTSGAAINAQLVEVPTPGGVVLSGSDLYAETTKGGTVGGGYVAEYTTSGATVNASLVTGLSGPSAIAISGSDIYTLGTDYGTIGEYTTSGATVNANLITNLYSASAITVVGSDLYVLNAITADEGSVAVYNATSGALINANLLSCTDPGGIASSSSDLYIINTAGDTAGQGSIGEYTTAGATVNANLITGLNSPVSIAFSGTDLYVGSVGSLDTNGQYDLGTIGQYTADGVAINASLVSGISAPDSLAVTPQSIGAASKLGYIQQPATVAANNPISPAVSVAVEDSNGNIITSNTSNVTVALTNSAGAVLGGTLTQAAVNGVATFSNLSVNTPGTYTLTATDGSLTSAVSSSFTITQPFATVTNGVLNVTSPRAPSTISLSLANGTYTVTENSLAAETFTASQVTQINVQGSSGNDSITIESNMPATLGVSVQGGPGDDTIIGGPGNDTLGGGAGNDSISGGPGDDSIKGGAGDDLLAGGKGNDTLFGGLGNDTLRGALGDDSLNGGAGTNQFYGGQGNNTFYCVNGTADQIFAGAATNDSLIYGSSDNYIIESGVIPPGNVTLA